MKENRAADAVKEQELPLFAAANSGSGFVSFYDRIFERRELTHRYLLKGGPGTGKSSFMKRLAAHAEGKGMRVETYRCSSDPDSLDGIVLDGRIAVLDATAPHTVEPTLPGVQDEIVNLGEFWDAGRLTERYNDIVTLTACKSASYEKAYRFLSAAMAVDAVNRSLVLPCIRTDKAEGAVRRLLRTVPDGKGFSLLPVFVDSIGMKGRVRLDTWERMAKRLYTVEDYYGIGTLFLSLVVAEARNKACRVRVSYSPLAPDLPDGVFFEESGVCFVLADERGEAFEGRLNMKRFADEERLRKKKPEYRMNRRLFEGLMLSAEEALAEAGRYHFALEKQYGACMDFESLGRFTESFCQKIG